MQAELDQISKSCAKLNKLGLDVSDIMEEVRFLNRHIIIDSATSISELPEPTLHRVEA